MSREPTMRCTRRSFLTTMAGSSAAALFGWPRRAVWAAPPGPRESLRIAYFCDVHARVEWQTPRAMEIAAARINAQGADLVLCGGDCITDGFQSGRHPVAHRWRAYREHLHDRLLPPAITAIGNHDLVGAIPEDGSEAEPDPRSIFREELGIPRTYRSLDAGGYHLILLDAVQVTGGDLKYRGFVDAGQMAWLREDLAEVAPETPIVLLSHIPLLTAFFQATRGAEAAAPHNRVVVNNREVLDVFTGRPLRLVLQGHLHVNELLRWQETTFITGGAVCGRWWRGRYHGTDAGFGVLTLRPDRVEWDYIELGWAPRRPA